MNARNINKAIIYYTSKVTVHTCPLLTASHTESTHYTSHLK